MRWRSVLVLVLAAGCAAEPPAGETPPVVAEQGASPAVAGAMAAEEAPKAAVFLVPGGLSGETVRSLGAALAGLEGVLAAKPDTAAGTFVVTFRPGATEPGTIAERLAAAAPGVELMGLTTAPGVPASHDDCGACPYKDRCGGAH
ncbi:MAG: hypothetical protein FJ098_07185 [Deltaproteobacteria bacterium]|nr:hypothetical protein [Deltaproteobacteria bacterium]